jgi:hypothetical protein
MKQYKPLTKLFILVGLAVVSWVIFGLAIYGALRIAIKVLGPGI